MRLKDKVAIVTGGGAGFGEGIARRFAAEGAKVVVNDVNDEDGIKVAKQIQRDGGEAIYHHADVSSGEDMGKLVYAALERFDGLDIMGNNAGVPQRTMPMAEVSEAVFDRIFDVNVKSIYWSARHCVPVFRERGSGVFINTSSTAAISPLPGLVWYNGSKGAVSTITKAMAIELAPDNVPRQCRLSGRKRYPDAGRVHGWPGLTGDARQVCRDDTAGPLQPAAGHRQRGTVLGLGRGRLHHRRLPGGRRRPLHLGHLGCWMRPIVLASCPGCDRSVTGHSAWIRLAKTQPGCKEQQDQGRKLRIYTV